MDVIGRWCASIGWPGYLAADHLLILADGGGWNPVEHRLFGLISLNWAGEPLRDWETMLAFIRGTKTATGLTVQAFLHAGVYKTGGTVSDAEMETLNLERHVVCPNWNHPIRPRSGGQAQTPSDPAKRELVS